MNKYYILALLFAVIVAAAFVMYGKPKPVNNPPAAAKTIQIFFGNTAKNPNAIDCGAVFPVNRSAPSGSDYGETLKQLFSGPTLDETAQGYTSFFSAQTADILIKVKTIDDTAYVNLKDIRPMIPNASASCGSQEFIGEVEKTLFQDGNIKKVMFAINGDPTPFYEWMQIGCAPSNNNCDSAPFK